MTINSQRASIGTPDRTRKVDLQGIFYHVNKDYQYYLCNDEKMCSQIKAMERCWRTCNSSSFVIDSKSTVIFSQEDIIIAQCENKAVENVVMNCSEYAIKDNDTNLVLKDCIDGHFIKKTSNEATYQELRDLFNATNMTVDNIPSYQDLVLYENKPFYINVEGCLNFKPCIDVLKQVENYGQNQSVPNVYTCLYDINQQIAIWEQSQPKEARELLVLMVTVPLICCILSIACLSAISISFKVSFY